MSNGIIYATEVANYIICFGLIVLLLFVAIAVISCCIMAYYAKKANKHGEEAEKIREELRADQGYIPRELETEILDEDDESLKAQKMKLAQMNDEREKKDKYRKKYDTVDNIAHSGAMICIVSWIVGFFLVALISTCFGGSIHDIKKVENVTNEGISVNAYYRVSYDTVEQETLTVFVKNDSKKVLSKARIIEKKTGASAEVENIDLGQEKIVSIVVYPTDDGKYEFELKDIEYYD